MNAIKSYLPCLLSSFFILGTLAGGSVHAQNVKQADDGPALQSLLNEVRVLNKNLQRTGLNAPRSQMLLERMRTHREQVVRLTRMLEEAREVTEKTEATIPRFIEQIKMIEDVIERETDLTKRAQLEFEAKDKRLAVERYKSGLERQREKEQQLTAQLRAEQIKLAELESRLDVLEREMESEVDRQKKEETLLEKSKLSPCAEAEKRPG